ncbi:MAG: hypothetical protein ACOCYD_00310 [bacterium]
MAAALVGPARANQILKKRPFDSHDGLTEIRGISSRQITDMKKQGRAVVIRL